jgi:CubicO group peptidase (beta-lactamase class C family)
MVIILINCNEGYIMKRQNNLLQKPYWNYTLPISQSMDSNSLEEMKQYLRKYFPEYYHLLVIKNGYIIFDDKNENPAEGILSRILKSFFRNITKLFKKPTAAFIDIIDNTYNMRSVTKSIISILIGIAVEQGLINNLDEPVYKLLAGKIVNNDTSKEAITIRYLLDMTAGFPSIEETMQALKFTFSDGDWINYIWNLKIENTPGENFKYNSANTHLLSGVISNVSGMSTFEFAKKYLFNPLGITNFYWETDKKGINFGGGNLFLNIYDLAKIGKLIINKGDWDNSVIISEEWLQKSFTSYNEWLYGFSYGFLWYIKEEICTKTQIGYITYSASGAGGQKLIIIPDLDIIVVAVSRTDLTKDNSYHINNIIGKYVLPAIIKSTTPP